MKKKNFFNAKIILIFILLLATVLRLWNLPNVPPSTSMDEASIGYNAYSVLKTGGDEYGKFPLLSQRAYDDWRRSTYLLLVVPFIALFNLNVVAIRLPAVILSILTVWATHYIVLLLFAKRSSFAISVALFSTLLLAISPWHIYISRLGHESNACLAFFIFGVLFFFQGLKNKNKFFLSLLFFTLSMVSYPSGQAFIPPFVAGAFFIFRKNLLSFVYSDKKILIPFFIFIVLLIPIFLTIFSPDLLVRFQGTSTFKPEAHSDVYSNRVILRNNAVKNGDIIGTIWYNRHLFPFQVFLEGYTAHFNPKWLFTNFSSDQFKAPHVGLLYLWEAPVILIGMCAFLFSKLVTGNIKRFLFLWFLLAPVPGAIATQAPHAMRVYNILPTWQIFAAFGLVYLLYKFKKFDKLILLFFLALIVNSVVIFYNNYFIAFPKEQSRSFYYGFSKAMPYVLSQRDQYKKIIFSNKDNLYQSYMVFLYYSRYNPSLYQKMGGTKSGGYAETHAFDKYEFRPINFKKEQMEKGVLYVTNVSEVPDEKTALKAFYSLDGTEVIDVFKQ